MFEHQPWLDPEYLAERKREEAERREQPRQRVYCGCEACTARAAGGGKAVGP